MGVPSRHETEQDRISCSNDFEEMVSATEAESFNVARQQSAKTWCVVGSAAGALLLGGLIAAARLSANATDGTAVAVQEETSVPAEAPTAAQQLKPELTRNEADRLKGLAYGYCGITVNPGMCGKYTRYLNSVDPTAAEKIFCKELGGEDRCSLSVSDANHGLNKDPNKCFWAPLVMYLWNVWDSEDEAWVLGAWHEYADKWGEKLVAARQTGLQISSPRFGGEDVLKKFDDFFSACPECSQNSSKYYIDIIAFDAMVVNGQANNKDLDDRVTWLKSTARALQSRYGGRPIVVTNFGSSGGSTAALQAEVLDKSGLFSRGTTGIDSLYYFAAVNYNNRHNFVDEKIQSGPRLGQTIAQVLLEHCGPSR